jgi:MoaA/NifB/PqqE/SkfB family radical SAM enzyme
MEPTNLSAGDIHGKIYDMTFFWSVTKTCNFSCPQCIGEAQKDKFDGPYAPEIINIKALKNLLKKSTKTIKFSFSGGEPLYVRNIIKAFKVITKKHYAVLMTNLTHPSIVKFANQIDPQRVPYITATAHMHELKKKGLVGKFIDYCLLLRKKGFTLYVSAIAYPHILDKVEKYKELFGKYGIDLCFKSFRGIWKNKNYPDAYTEEEIKGFNLNEYDYYNPTIFNQHNKLCNAGYNAAIILNDGEVRPCYSIHNRMGNIYDKIEFKERMIKCPFKSCPCPFPVFEPYLFNKAVMELKAPV